MNTLPNAAPLTAPAAQAHPARTRRLPALLLSALLPLSALMAAPAALADAAWPSRPLRLIVPFPPGGGADIVGRLVGARLGERLGQTVNIENRAGAGTIIAAQAAATAAPDGYTLSLATTGQLTINPALHEKLPYDPVKSFTPVSLVASVPYIVSVNASADILTLKDLLDRAKKQPGALAYASCGNGTVCHLAGELLKASAGVDLLHVPYAGSAPGLQALLGNQVQLTSDTVAIQAPHLKSGKLRGLVVSDKQRSAAAPEVPTAAEAGLPDFIASSWFGIVVPAGTPAPVVQRLNRELSAITQLPEVKEQLAKQGLQALYSTPEGFGQQIQADLGKWAVVVRNANIRAD